MSAPGRNLLLGIAACVAACSHEAPPAAHRAAEYVDEAGCAECHAEASAAWQGSNHALALQIADASSVRGDFGGASFTNHGVETHFTKKDGRFVVQTVGADGARHDFEVAYTFGVEPLQQYLVRGEAGRVQCLTIAWDTEQKRWFDLYPDEAFAPGDELHWSGRYQRWNVMCAQCHSTDLVKHYDAASDGYHTSWSGISVGCQACHGPASEHVAAARAGRSGPGTSGFATPLRRTEQRAQLDACGPCHAMRTPITSRWMPSEPFFDHFVPELLRESTYEPDGQVKAEVYVYGSFLQSKMAQKGVACADCHDPHSLAPRGAANQVCTQCHQPTPPLNRFPTLPPKLFDAPEHHHHAAGSAGASCIACHMPAKTFMQLDVRRDHAFRVPRPDLSVAYGLPNACNECHKDKDAAWAAAATRTWWPELAARKSFAPALALARRGDPSQLDALARDAEAPAIARATALEQLGARGGLESSSVQAALRDPDPLVRFGALAGIAGLGAEQLALAGTLVVPLLDDALRGVRIEAARLLSVFGRERLPEAARASFDRAWAEFVQAQLALDDMPGAHLNLAVVNEARGDDVQAEAEYRRALKLDAGFLPARFNLTQLLHRKQRSAEAEALLRAGLVLAPDEAELHHSLGLLVNELGRTKEAADELLRASELAPDDTSKCLDAAIALGADGRGAASERLLLRAAGRAPRDPRVLVAVVDHFVAKEEWARALPYVEQLARLTPFDETVQELLAHVRAEVAEKR